MGDDEVEIMQVAQTERLARDFGQWDRMVDTYHEDSKVRLSWFEGTGAEFVEASRQRHERGERSIHLVGMTVVQLNEDRAIADTGCTINIRRPLDGVVVDISCFCRHRSRVEKIDGRWRLRSLSAVYQKDVMATKIPGDHVEIDRDELDRYRPSYAWLCYSNAHSGGQPNDGLPGVDRMELVDELIRSEEAWLAREW